MSLTKHSKTDKNLYLMNGSHFIKEALHIPDQRLLQVLKAFENALESKLKYITGNRA